MKCFLCETAKGRRVDERSRRVNNRLERRDLTAAAFRGCEKSRGKLPSIFGPSLTEEEEGDVGHGEGAEEDVGRRPHRGVLEDDVAHCERKEIGSKNYLTRVESSMLWKFLS